MLNIQEQNCHLECRIPTSLDIILQTFWQQLQQHSLKHFCKQNVCFSVILYAMLTAEVMYHQSIIEAMCCIIVMLHVYGSAGEGFYFSNINTVATDPAVLGLICGATGFSE